MCVGKLLFVAPEWRTEKTDTGENHLCSKTLNSHGKTALQAAVQLT
jgi:hypothetical protein